MFILNMNSLPTSIWNATHSTLALGDRKGNRIGLGSGPEPGGRFKTDDREPSANAQWHSHGQFLSGKALAVGSVTQGFAE